MTNDLASSYPTGEYLIGNFIEDYIAGYTYFDTNVARKYGDRGLEVPEDETLSETVTDWIQNVNSIVFSHINDWAKMYSASLKDYEPLWNVDGTVTNTYGATLRTDNIGARQVTDQFGQTVNSTQYGAKSETDTVGARSDSHSIYKTTYPDTTERKTDRNDDSYGAQSNGHSEQAHTDQTTLGTHTDTHSELARQDTSGTAQHVDTERRTGNIGVTKSTELVESEYKLRATYNFFDIIFKYIMKEMGVIYYDWNRCI